MPGWNKDCWEKYQQPQICKEYHSNGRKWRGTKKPVEDGGRGDWKSCFKIQHSKTKIVASSLITSWQIEGGKVETVTDFVFLSSRITVDDDCSHEIQGHCFLEGKYKNVNCSVVNDFLLFHRLSPTRLLCPWNSPGNNTRVGCHSLLQGIFLTHGANPGLLHCRQILYYWATREPPSFKLPVCISSVQALSHVWLFVTLWTAARQVSLSIINSQSPPKPMSIESMTPSNHLILCRPLLLLPWIFSSLRVFSNESALHIRWPKYWSFSFNISPSNVYEFLLFMLHSLS